MVLLEIFIIRFGRDCHYSLILYSQKCVASYSNILSNFLGFPGVRWWQCLQIYYVFFCFVFASPPKDRQIIGCNVLILRWFKLEANVLCWKFPTTFWSVLIAPGFYCLHVKSRFRSSLLKRVNDILMQGSSASHILLNSF